MKRVIGILILFAATVAAANDGYVLRDGYYWQGNQPYSRYKEWSQVYNRYTCTYSWTWKWGYEQVALAYPPIPKAPVTPPNWQVEVAKVYAAQQDHSAYLEALKLIGANGSQPSYMHGSQILGSQGIVSGQTLYARSTTLKADLYGSAAELAVLYAQQSARLASDSQAYADKSIGRHSEASERQQRLLEILAKSEAAIKLIEAVNKEQPRIKFEQRTTEPFMPPAKEQTSSDGRFEQLVVLKCSQCHGAAKQEGNLDMRQWPTFTAQRKDEINARLLPGLDPKRRMPLNHPPLTTAERILFLSN